jgi:hypothetical protein
VKLHALTAAADAVEAIAENRFRFPVVYKKPSHPTHLAIFGAAMRYLARRRAGIRRFP